MLVHMNYFRYLNFTLCSNLRSLRTYKYITMLNFGLLFWIGQESKVPSASEWQSIWEVRRDFVP